MLKSPEQIQKQVSRKLIHYEGCPQVTIFIYCDHFYDSLQDTFYSEVLPITVIAVSELKKRYINLDWLIEHTEALPSNNFE